MPENQHDVITKEMVKNIANEAAREAVHETFLVLGVDLKNRDEVKSLQRALALASTADSMWRTILFTAITNLGVAATSVLATWLWLTPN